jgi:hypothetical protein
MLTCIIDGVMTVKPECQTTGNTSMIWSNGCLSYCSLHQKELMFGEHTRKATIQNAWFGSNSETWGWFCDGLSSNMWCVQKVSNLIFSDVNQ